MIFHHVVCMLRKHRSLKVADTYMTCCIGRFYDVKKRLNIAFKTKTRILNSSHLHVDVFCKFYKSDF